MSYIGVVQGARQRGCLQWSLAGALSFLVACSSSYEAPVDDRSNNLERQRAEILSSGQSGSGVARNPATASPAPQSASTSQGQVGSAATVVRPVAIGGGVRRVSSDTSTAGGGSSSQSPSAPSSVPLSSSNLQSSAPVQQQSVSSAADRPAAANQSPTTGAVHVVARGDTLYSIAWTHNLDVRTVALVNNLNPPYTIFPGQRLIVSDQAIASSALSNMPEIPASPAGENIGSSEGQRPSESVAARRTGSINTRTLDGVQWQWPADGRLLSTFSDTQARRGINIAGARGNPVYAAADGDVVYAGQGIQGAGNLVILRHSARHLSAYMYNSRVLVGEGDSVRGGDKIAEIGTGPDGRDLLHFEVRVDGKPSDPTGFLPSR